MRFFRNQSSSFNSSKHYSYQKSKMQTKTQHLVPLNMPEEQKQKLLQEDQEETYEISVIRNHREVPCELESAQTG